MAARPRSVQLRRRLVRELEAGGWIRTTTVRDAFLSVPRELFVPYFAAARGLAAVYQDEAIVTKQDPLGGALSSSSQPAIMAAMLEQLRLEQGMRVLEIGAGTGYNAALLSVLVGRRGRVVSVDVDLQIAREARVALRAGGFRANVLVGDGREGVVGQAPYDRIIVTASSPGVPIAWFDQLGQHGVLEVPLQLGGVGAQAIPVLRKTNRGLRSTSVICGGFIPLRAPGKDAVAPYARPALIATDLTSGLPLQQIYGPAVEGMSTQAKRRLLSLSLGQGRRRPLGLRAPIGALALFLSLEVPKRELIFTMPRRGIGVVARDGRSLALIEPPAGPSGRTVSSLWGFGGEESEEHLLRHVWDWHRRGRPDESSFEVTIAFDGSGASKLRYSWG